MSDRGAEDGLTLVELLVVMLLIGIIGSVVSTTLIFAMKTTRYHQNRTYAAEEVQAQLERVARSIRVGDPIRAASATSITVDLYRGTSCVRQSWTLAGTTLQVTSVTYAAWDSCAKYPATVAPSSTSTTTAVTGVANGSTPLFTYEDPTGAVLTSPTPWKIAAVHVQIMKTVPERTSRISFSTSVGVRNEALA